MSAQINLITTSILSFDIILINDGFIRFSVLLHDVTCNFQSLYHPIIQFLVVHGQHLHSFKFLARYEVFQYELLELDFLLDLSSTFLKFLNFTSIKFIKFLILVLDLLQSLDQYLDSFGFVIHLILLGIVNALQLHHLIFTFLQFRCQLLLINLLLLKLLHCVI